MPPVILCEAKDLCKLPASPMLVWGQPPSAVHRAQPGGGGHTDSGITSYPITQLRNYQMSPHFFHSLFSPHVTDDLVFHRASLFNSTM
jgi:hypothetical protein